ncbi:MAG: AMP-binding protein [Magnetococcales bacterium]|nr:AMP-binding protein [Magnetococcales bacterium]
MPETQQNRVMAFATFFQDISQEERHLFECFNAATGKTDVISTFTFNEMVHQWCRRLEELPSTVVPIFGHSSPEMMAAWFGALKVGKRPTFLSYPNQKISAEAYQTKLENYRHKFGTVTMVGESTEKALVPDLITPNTHLEREHPQKERLPEPMSHPSFLQCSSGTTGLQKAVEIDEKRLINQLQACSKALSLDPENDAIVSWLPLYHDMGLIATFLLPLLTRTPVTYIDTFDWASNPTLLLQVLEQKQATLCWLPNFAFSFLTKVTGEYDLGSVRSFINCSEPVSQIAFDRFMRRFNVRPQQLSISYALAENVFAATHSAPGSAPIGLHVERSALHHGRVRAIGSEPLNTQATDEKHQGSDTPFLTIFSCGRSVEGTEIKIDAEDGRDIGEVLLRGNATVESYVDADSPRSDGWFPTGDLGFIHNGELYISGRIKDLIIHNGKNIYPHDLEEIVNNHPATHPGRCVAFGERDSELESERIIILFEPKQTLNTEEKRRVQQQLQEQIEMLFDVRVQVNAVPRMWLHKTSSGKIVRSANRERFQKESRRTIHILGDSHVRILWTNHNSHENMFRHLRAYWLGLLRGDNWKEATRLFEQIIATFNPNDILIISAGEPECRNTFPGSDNPRGAITEAIHNYVSLFEYLRGIWGGEIAFMSGIPTTPVDKPDDDGIWPVLGTAQERYAHQALFYTQMKAVLTRMGIPFIDLCSPFLDNDGLMSPNKLFDGTHLHPIFREIYIRLLEGSYGFVNSAPEEVDPLNTPWNGTYEHYLTLMTHYLHTKCSPGTEPDLNHLVSGGVLDSMGVVELISLLEQFFRFKIPLMKVGRDDFESVQQIYRRFAPDFATPIPEETP